MCHRGTKRSTLLDCVAAHGISCAKADRSVRSARLCAGSRLRIKIYSQDLIHTSDKNPNSTCAALINHVTSKGLDGLPSSSLRFALGTLLGDSYMRTLIPPLVYRLNRCGSNDINVLKKFVTTLSSSLAGSSEDESYVSDILFFLIVFSEMWEIPTPSKAEMKARFTE